jgi:glycine/D-amino acid oxidase-like deaminating enzyme
VHALLRILLREGNLNLQAHTPVTEVSKRDANGWITVTTARGTIRAKSVVHTTNRWASHLLPEFSKLILPLRGPVSAIKAPAGFLKRTGAQHWDAVCNVRHGLIHDVAIELILKTELPSPTSSAVQYDHPRRGKTSDCPQARNLHNERRRGPAD